MSGRWVPRQRPGLDSKPLRENLMVYDTNTGGLHTLNESAARIFLLCDGATDGEGMARILSGEYEAAPGEIGAVVAEGLELLRSKGLVV